MRILITSVILFFTLGVLAQPRNEKPLPFFTDDPVTVLEDDVTGWSLSLDGQWVSAEKTIPPRLISRDDKAYKERINRLGLDNFEEMMIFPILYGKDTLLMLIKTFESGEYEYEYTKRGWDKEDKAHYFVIKARGLNKLNSLQDSTIQLLKFKMLDGGLINDYSSGSIIATIKDRILIRDKYNYEMHLMVQPLSQLGKVRFHIYSMHSVFPDVEGVLKDFTVNGHTAYGSKLLFDYMYYETSLDNFSKFFSLPGSVEFEQD